MTLSKWVLMVGNVSWFGENVVKGKQCDSLVVLGQSGRKEGFLILKIKLGNMWV